MKPVKRMGGTRKFARFCLLEIHSQCKGNRTVFFTIIVTVSVTLAAVLVLINILLTSAQDIDESNRRKCIYSPGATLHTTWCEMRSELANLTEILEGSSTLPPAAEYEWDLVMDSTENDSLFDSSGTWYAVGRHIIVGDDSRLSSDTAAATEAAIIAGKMPNPREKHEPPLILLTQDTRNNFFPAGNIGDTINIGSTTYQIAAILAREKNEETADYENMILGADLEDNAEVQITLQTITFTKPLNASQRAYFNRFLTKYDVLETRNVYEMQLFGEIMTYATYFVIAVMLLLFCMVIIMRLFRYIFTDRRYVYNLYKIHGIGQDSLAAVLAVGILLVTLLSSALGIGLFTLSQPIQWYFYIDRTTPPTMIAAVMAALMVLTTLTALPTVRQLAKRPPFDRTFWQ